MGINIYGIFALIAGVSSFSFGLFVYTENKKEQFNRLFLLLSIGFSIWTFSYFIWLLQISEISALFWSRMLNLGATLIPPFYLHWIFSFLGINKRRRRVVIFAYLITIIFSLFSFSPLYIKGVKQVFNFPFWPQAGPLYDVFLLFSFFGCVMYALLGLIRAYRDSNDTRKIRIKYLIIATIMGFGGGATNFPLMHGISLIPPYGMFLVIFHPFLFYYAITKYRLFDIRVITTELFTFTICVILIARTLLSEGLREMIINGSIFISVALFGILLVRSVTKEVKQREQIEVMADDVRRAYEVEKKARETEKINREKAEGLTKELKRLETAKNQFIMATQHHLRTPLTSMRGYLDLIAGGTYGKVPPKLKEVLKKFEKSTLNEIQIVNELLDISQFQLGKEVVILQPDIDIESMLKEIVGEIKIEAEKKNLYLKVERPKEFLPKIKADPTKLKVALFNLVDNAVKYTKEGGVSIKVQTTDSKLQIAVKDTGMGVPKEELPDIFTRVFERSKEAQKSNTTGRGIGLYLTANIIKSHHGEIWAESEGVGKGSTFFVELPVG